MGKQIVVHEFDRGEYYAGFESSPEAEEACAMIERDHELSYGQAQAIAYESYYKFWRRKHLERKKK